MWGRGFIDDAGHRFAVRAVGDVGDGLAVVEAGAAALLVKPGQMDGGGRFPSGRPPPGRCGPPCCGSGSEGPSRRGQAVEGVPVLLYSWMPLTRRGGGPAPAWRAADGEFCLLPR